MKKSVKFWAIVIVVILHSSCSNTGNGTVKAGSAQNDNLHRQHYRSVHDRIYHPCKPDLEYEKYKIVLEKTVLDGHEVVK